MPVASTRPAPGHISNASKQVVINAVLLRLSDPVRGAPTKDSLDGYLDENTLTTAQLMQKFLDSFALICSTSSAGKETASAVCLEQTQESARVLRVARNLGLPPRDQAQLEDVVQVLVVVAEGSMSHILTTLKADHY